MSAAETIPGDTPQRGKSATGGRLFDTLPSETRTTGEAAAARSRLVRRLRIALPIMALILIAAFVFNTQSSTEDPTFLDDFKTVAAATEELQMANPRFAGVDDRGNPFDLTAANARQKPDNRDVVELESPRAVQGGPDEQSVVTAQNGVYYMEDNLLELTENVTLEHRFGDETYVLRAPEATVQIKQEKVLADAGVAGSSSDGGALKADRMQAYNDKNKVVFEGNVSMRIYPNSAEKLTNADSADDSITEVNLRSD
ncbi:MAG: LPS export ABC transporter periplasmic protein LptC [Pseudomonadota bacterium]